MKCYTRKSKMLRKAALLALLLLSSLSLMQPAFAIETVTGNTLLEQCTTKLSIPQTRCVSFIQGVIEGYGLSATSKPVFCFPEKANIDRTKKIIVKYLKKHASMLNRSAGELVLRALSEAWPCTNQP